eukprot:TRINITY_DN19842_c0_g1_i1.p1 TRINITY_DN19842_c0_g1~~TRINITY_DN19842_c0_g1_i1.p1  ORF type:complete len:173 (-),score=19.27 TRINITY_DN19842_c0_g1_i1:391-909(-)
MISSTCRRGQPRSSLRTSATLSSTLRSPADAERFRALVLRDGLQVREKEVEVQLAHIQGLFNLERHFHRKGVSKSSSTGGAPIFRKGDDDDDLLGEIKGAGKSSSALSTGHLRFLPMDEDSNRIDGELPPPQYVGSGFGVCTSSLAPMWSELPSPMKVHIPASYCLTPIDRL